MAPVEGMETFEARLASFSQTIPGAKRRASNAKGTKTGSWPHRLPAPESLAQAGFYYKPSPTSPDNTVCFMCERKLDGWEEEDDPILEHLKHSTTCPWALVMSAGMDGAEDPTSEKILDARRQTFEGRWPHEGKRGWVPKAEKMVIAGWYYNPTPESDDFVACAHCDLCLDGWEPKDNPFEEHHRRRPDCRFFQFAGTTEPKAKRGRKARASKTSRLSTQSNVTTTSEVADIPDFEDSIDHTTLSQDTVVSTTSKAQTKAGRAGKKKTGKGTKSKKIEPSDLVEDYSIAEITKEEGEIAPSRRGRKRTSEQISIDDEDHAKLEDAPAAEPPAKRRLTRSRASMDQNIQYPELSVGAPEDMEMETSQALPKGRKRASSRARKVSTASKASLRAGIPDDSTIDAVLAAELERPLSDDEGKAFIAVEIHPPKPKAKGRKTKNTASTASVRQPPAEIPAESTVDAIKESEESVDIEVTSQVHKEEQDRPKKKGKSTRTKGKKKDAIEPKHHEAIAPMEEERIEEDSITVEDTESAPATATQPKESEPHIMEHDIEIHTDEHKPKKGSKRKGPERSKAPKQKLEKTTEIMDYAVSEMETQDQVESPSMQDLMDSMPLPPASADKKANKARGKAKGQQRSMPGAFEPETSTRISSPPAPDPMDDFPTPTAVPSPPQRPIQAATPSPSPQPSDAENQPPSSRPSASRPPLLPLSPSKGQTVRIPLATTPKQSPSKLNRPMTELSTAYAWNPVGVEMVFVQTPGAAGQENLFAGVGGTLPSPEKRMTVDEWVSNVAQRTESQLKAECERVVGIFEKEGSRAMMALEGIQCIE